jgi:hypothetical protein
VPSFLSKPARLFYRAGLGPGPKSGLRAGLTGLVLFGHLYVQRGLGGGHDRVHLLLPAGDQGRAHRVTPRGVGAPLVLEALRQAAADAAAAVVSVQSGGWAGLNLRIER